MDYLLSLLLEHVHSLQSDVLDSLDARRRFEIAYPEIGRALGQTLSYEPPQMAARLLDLADRLLGDSLPGYPRQSVDTVRKRIALT